MHDRARRPRGGYRIAIRRSGGLVCGEALTVAEAEELYLERNLSEVVRLVASDLTDDAFRGHPLIQLLVARGSRPWEDSLS